MPRLVRNCALGRGIQYAELFIFRSRPSRSTGSSAPVRNCVQGGRWPWKQL